jgi:DNA-binding transcriptional LysR family regulator
MSIYDHLEFRHLKYIVAVAEAGTFTGAAARIPVSQSAISRQINEIEEVYGIEIFERDRGGATLTDVGEALVGFSRQLLDTRIEIIQALQAIQQAAMRPFRLGFTSFVRSHVLSIVCGTYRDLFPNGDIRPESGDIEDLLERMKTGTLDAALVTLPLSSDGFRVQPVMHEPLVVCIRKDDPLASLGELPPESLNGKLGIFSDPRHHPSAHTRLLEMLGEQGIKPLISNPTFSAEHVQWMVREHLCVALIRPQDTLHEELTTRPIQGVNWTIDSAIVYVVEHGQSALPLLLRDLERRFSVADIESKKKPPRSVEAIRARRKLPFSR